MIGKDDDEFSVVKTFIPEEDKLEEIRICSIGGACALKFKHEIHRRNFVMTAWVCFSLTMLGWTYGQLGTAFTDLQQILDTSLERASIIYTMNSVGYITGAVVGGFLCDRVGRHLLLLCLLSVGMAATSVVTPWCRHYGLHLTVRLLGGIACGATDAVGNAKVATSWSHHSSHYIQFLHFMYAFGGIISPLITSPFLAPRYTMYHNITAPGEDFNPDIANATVSAESTSLPDNGHHENETFYAVTESAVSIVSTTGFGETYVHYAFLITGILSTLSALSFVYLIYQGYESTPPMTKVTAAQNKTSFTRPHMSLSQSVVFVVVLGLLVWFYCAIECKIQSFLMPFILFLDWTKAQGALLISALWATFGIGRFSGIFILRILTPTKMIILFLTMILVFSVCLLPVRSATVLMWIFVPLVGFSMSIIFSVLMVWVNKNAMPVNGKMAALFLGAGSVGFMVGPLYVGVLMDKISPMWFIYVQIIEAVITLGLFFLLGLYVRRIRLTHKAKNCDSLQY